MTLYDKCSYLPLIAFLKKKRGKARLSHLKYFSIVTSLEVLFVFEQIMRQSKQTTNFQKTGTSH